ncbi:sulfite oxidase [Sutcliffiella cohnii]|uniref:sulfite oxidase n=1 Tax=Sutcliffiella cohnii TaxID=33932 RepID=UPI002E24CF77|nr:sulfite oxidase [Sutcliffiella cohnii]
MNLSKPYLTTRSLQPENQETPIQFIKNNIISERLFFRRNHFSYPNLTYSSYWLPVNGHVRNPQLFSLQNIMSLPSKTLTVVLECAGNKRSFFEPKVFGEQWEKGAISQGVWKGVPLKTLLQLAHIKEGALEVVVEGYDVGKRTDTDKVYSYARSLPIEKALHEDTLVAYEYNGGPIPFKHGFPLRLIVPQWYGMASVKWVKQITIVNRAFSGPFQTVDYVYYPKKDSDEGATPVTTMRVNSSIQKPLNREILTTGVHEINGIAWTGKGLIVKVEISTDSGQTWTEVKLRNKDQYSWIDWSYDWEVAEKGEYTILSKATDSHGRVQRKEPYWNRKGYGYNGIDRIKVKVE